MDPPFPSLLKGACAIMTKPREATATTKEKVPSCSMHGSQVSTSLDPAMQERIDKHPCYSEEAHHFYARMHVAVAPACNIQCHYCNRKYDCANESRPGVTSEVLTPEEAARKVLVVAGKIPQMTVLGIAGPGDPLANPEKTFRTFELIADKAPDIKLCLSTNGLKLVDHIDRLKNLNIDHVTITINMVDPEIGQNIYSWVYFNHKRYKGKEAARILHERQMEGLQALTENHILCKVNSVMIPQINDRHLAEVSQEVKKNGAFLHNIMPLLLAPGAYYDEVGQRGPTPQEVKELQDQCEGDMNLMRHCRQCRADAVGLLGEDRGNEFTKEQFLTMPIEYDPNKRAQVHAEISERVDKVRYAREFLKSRRASPKTKETLTIAVTSKGEGMVNQHFGHANEFLIYRASKGGTVSFIGARRVGAYCAGVETCGDAEDSLDRITNMINDCNILLTSRIGKGPRDAVAAAGIEIVQTYDRIETAISKLLDRKPELTR